MPNSKTKANPLRDSFIHYLSVSTMHQDNDTTKIPSFHVNTDDTREEKKQTWQDGKRKQIMS